MSDSTGGMTDLDDIDVMEMIMQQLQYEQSLQEQEAESSNRHNNIYRRHDVAEECLMAVYFGDYQNIRRIILEHALIVCTENGKLVRKNGTANLREAIKIPNYDA
uniref:Uncharacterized protein n=1 Tax=Tanacetum cinerariifolium TaxID=118510 RepID=A0A6L2K358_TANCI|nr:hypothetical protein [Tanacetum cinerariifolium]